MDQHLQAGSWTCRRRWLGREPRAACQAPGTLYVKKTFEYSVGEAPSSSTFKQALRSCHLDLPTQVPRQETTCCMPGAWYLVYISRRRLNIGTLLLVLIIKIRGQALSHARLPNPCHSVAKGGTPRDGLTSSASAPSLHLSEDFILRDMKASIFAVTSLHTVML